MQHFQYSHTQPGSPPLGSDGDPRGVNIFCTWLIICDQLVIEYFANPGRETDMPDWELRTVEDWNETNTVLNVEM